MWSWLGGKKGSATPEKKITERRQSGTKSEKRTDAEASDPNVQWFAAPPPPRPPPSALLLTRGAGHCVRRRSKRRPARSPSTPSCPTLPPTPPPVPSPRRIVFVARCACRGACRVLLYSRGEGTFRGSSALRLHLRHALDAQLHQGHAGRRRMSRHHFHLGQRQFPKSSLRGACLWWCVL